MTVVFADTAFYIAFSSPKDTWHEAAKSFALGFSGAMLTTEFVLVEFANHLCAPQDRALFLRFHAMLRDDANTSIVPASSECIQNGLALYADRPDKGWSLTDCISMSVMQERGLNEVLTTDRHFGQAGFRTLLHR